MDFIIGLPKSKGKSVIMVVVEGIAMYTHFCALSHPFKVSIVSNPFMETIRKLYGNPKIIVSNRDPIFTRDISMELFSCLGTQLAQSSSYHPQSDGKNEIVNKFLEGYIFCFVFDRKKNGSNGCLWLKSGVTLAYILQQKDPIYGTLLISSTIHNIIFNRKFEGSISGRSHHESETSSPTLKG